MKAIIPAEAIERKIYLIRGEKVMLSSDLTELYGVEPKVLIQAVKRNNERFPKDFMFQLTNQEVINLKSQKEKLLSEIALGKVWRLNLFTKGD